MQNHSVNSELHIFYTFMSASYQTSDHLSEQVVISLFLFSVSKTDYNNNNNNGFLLLCRPEQQIPFPVIERQFQKAQININCDVHHRQSHHLYILYLHFFSSYGPEKKSFRMCHEHTSFILYLMGIPIPSRSKTNLNIIFS